MLSAYCALDSAPEGDSVTVVRPFQAKPSIVHAGLVGDVQDAVIDTGLVQTLSDLVPGQWCHALGPFRRRG